MDLVTMLSNVTDLDKYNHVTKFTNILCENVGFDVKSNNISILRVLENLHLIETEYYYNYRKKGAVFILLERLAEIEPSTQWIHISKIMIRILRKWLTASTDLILKDGWMFVKNVMNIIYKISKKCNNIVHLCEPIIVLVLNSYLNSNQKHELGECLNHISVNLTKTQRSLVQPNLVKHFPDIAAMIGPCGHFPCQYSLLEILIRWLLDRNNPKARREAANVWFPANRFSTRAKQIFLERTWDNFPKDARDFLNAVNHDEQSVISVQIRKIKMGDEILIRSAWWWLDINMATRSVSMMVPKKKLPLIQESTESHSSAFYLSADNTDNVTLQRIGYENIVTMSSINNIQLHPTQKTTAWKTITVSVTRQYVEIVDKGLKQIFANKYKALENIEKGIYPSEGETTNYNTESDFSRFSEPEKQNSSFAALKKFATPNYSSEKVISHTKPIATIVQNTEAQIMSNIDRKMLGESNQAKSEATVGSQNDFNETAFDKLLRDTAMCENKDDVRKRDTPSLTLPNSVRILLSPLDNTLIRKDSKNLGIQGKFDSKTVGTFFHRDFTESKLKRRPVTINETSSDDSLPQSEKHDVNTENITEIRHCSNNDVNIDLNKSSTEHSEKNDAEKSKLTLRKYFNKNKMKNGNSNNLGAIANESGHVSLKQKDRCSDSLIEKNVSVNDHGENIDVYKFSYNQPTDKTLLTKREKWRRSPAKYNNKAKEEGKTSKRNNNEISKTTEKRNTKASINLRDETMRGASGVQLKDSELVKVNTTDKIDEPEPASVKDSHMEIIAENVARENEKELSNKKKLRKRTKKIKETIAEDNEKDISPFKKTSKYVKKIKENFAGENVTDLPTIKRNTKQTKKIKDTKKTDSQKTPPTQLPTQIVETKTRDNENVKDISSDVIRNEKNDSLNKIKVYNDSSDGNENENVNVLMPKETDVFDALPVHDSSSSLTLKTIVTSSTIKALNKTYEPRNLEYEYLKPQQRDLVSDLLSSIDRQKNKCYEPKRTDVLNTKAKEFVGTKKLELRVSVERISMTDFEKSSHTKIANLKSNKDFNTYKKPLTKAKSTPAPSVCLERVFSEKINLKTNKEVNINKKPLAKVNSTPSVCLKRPSSEKIARILRESCQNSIREHPEINRNSKVDAKEITLEARVTIESSLVIENKAAHNKRRKLVTPASERPLVEYTAQNKNRELVTPASERLRIEYTAQNKNRELVTPASERPLVEYKAQNKNRELVTPASERPLVENTAQNKNRELVTPASERPLVEYTAQNKNRELVTPASERPLVENTAQNKNRELVTPASERPLVEYTAQNKNRELVTPASERPLVENTAQNKNRELVTPASERPLVEYTAQNKNRELVTPASERPLVENTAQNKNRELVTPASERPLVENTAQNKNRELVTPASERPLVEYTAQNKNRELVTPASERPLVENTAQNKNRELVTPASERPLVEYTAQNKNRELVTPASERPLVENTAQNKNRELVTPASERPLVENTAQNKNRELVTPASERPLVEYTAQNKNRELVTPASERPLVENTAQNKNRELVTPASERPLVEYTAQNKNRELVTPARSPNRKRRLASRRESSVLEWVNEVDPRPKVSLSEHFDDLKKIVLESIDTRLDEIQRRNTQSTLNMCVDMDKKLDEEFEKQCNVNAQKMDDLGKHFCDLLKRENNRTTERLRLAFNCLHKELKLKSQNLLEGEVRRRRFVMTSLRDEIDNMRVNSK